MKNFKSAIKSDSQSCTLSTPIDKNIVFSQLNEVKRKIALVEGKRRALQSSFERENKGNRAALAKLGEEVQVDTIGQK